MGDVKVCPGCRTTKDRDEFHRSRHAKDGLQGRCKPCRKAARHLYREDYRRANLRRHYGLTPEDYDALLARQGGTCAVCPATVADATGYPLHVDHCHRSGRIRGLLCSNHNRALGMTQDDPATLRKLAEYLETHDGQ